MTKACLSTRALGVTLNGKVILSDLSLTFAPGTVTAVIGPNGAGKSTLLSCLAGLLKPNAGAVRLGERDLRVMPGQERARRIGILPQSQEIAWAVDVETLIGLGRLPYRGPFAGELGSEDRSIVAQVMAQTSTTLFANRTANTLSGGELGRVLMARALAGEPEWLLADEPLTGLDPGHQFDACDILRSAADKGRGVVVTLHELALAARLADRVVVLAGGRVWSDGAPRETLTTSLLAEVYGVEARVTEASGDFAITFHGRSHGGSKRL